MISTRGTGIPRMPMTPPIVIISGYDRKRPNCAAAHLCTPNADCQHGEQVIHAKDQGVESRQEAVERTRAGVCVGRNCRIS